MRAVLPLLAVLPMGCNFILDFEELEGLPCPCDEAHVCLIASNRCVPRASVSDFKSCSTDTDSGGDDLCKEGRICQDVNGLGPRCLPLCTPSTYATPEAALAIAAQCPSGTTCWETDRGGVCSEGVCRDLPNNCPPPQECVRVNGAGVCFTSCDIFQADPPACGGNQICHPIVGSRVTACVDSGRVERNGVCDDLEMCEKPTAGAPDPRPLICDRARQSTNPLRMCRPVCIPGDNSRCNVSLGESCVPAESTDLGICQGP